MTAEQLSLTSAALRGEWWRLWTGHLVHYDFAHLITNAVAVAVPLSLVPGIARRRLILAVPIIAPALSLVLLTCARFDQYRGASGVAMALWSGAALTLSRAGAECDRRTGHALLVIVMAKLAAEAAGGGHLWSTVAPLPLAHEAGFVIGALVAITMAMRTLPAPLVPRGWSAPGAEAAAATGCILRISKRHVVVFLDNLI